MFNHFYLHELIDIRKSRFLVNIQILNEARWEINTFYFECLQQDIKHDLISMQYYKDTYITPLDLLDILSAKLRILALLWIIDLRRRMANIHGHDLNDGRLYCDPGICGSPYHFILICNRSLLMEILFALHSKPEDYHQWFRHNSFEYRIPFTIFMKSLEFRKKNFQSQTMRKCAQNRTARGTC